MTNRDIPVTDASLNTVHALILQHTDADTNDAAYAAHQIVAALTIQGDTGDGLVERVESAICAEAERLARLGHASGISGVQSNNFARAALSALSTRPPVDVEALLSDIFDFLGGVDDAADLRGRILAALAPRSSGEGDYCGIVVVDEVKS